MSPEAQRETIATLAKVWALSPDVRLGQLLSHLGWLCEVHLNKGLAYVDDDELLAVILRHHMELAARHSSDSHPIADSMGISVSGSPTVSNLP